MKIADLRGTGRNPPAPMSISLDSGQVLVLDRWLRILPGKRLTGVGTWQGRSVLAKLFIAARGSQRHWKREHTGVAHLQMNALPTPGLLAAGSFGPDGHYLLYDYLAGAHAPDSTIATELASIFTLLGRMHSCGLIHEDAHLDNFLLADQNTYVIDGDAVRPTQDITEHIHNLALLFSQLAPDVETTMRATLLAAYCTGNPAAMPDADMLAEAISRSRAKRLKDYLDKTLRDCSQFHVTRSTERFVAIVRSHADLLAPVLAEPDIWLERGTPLKRGRTATLARIEIDGHPLVIKRYNIKGAAHALSRAWRPSRAWHAWQEGHRLGFLGIATPQPLALIERRLGPLRGKAWLITEYCPGTNLADQLAGWHGNPPASVLAAIGHLCEQLIAARISHGDFKATNLLWHGNRVELIDLDAMRQHHNAATFSRAWNKDRERLLRNWPADTPLHAALGAVVPS